jgi:hypothetical protein
MKTQMHNILRVIKLGTYKYERIFLVVLKWNFLDRDCHFFKLPHTEFCTSWEVFRKNRPSEIRRQRLPKQLHRRQRRQEWWRHRQKWWRHKPGENSSHESGKVIMPQKQRFQLEEYNTYIGLMFEREALFTWSLSVKFDMYVHRYMKFDMYIGTWSLTCT